MRRLRWAWCTPVTGRSSPRRIFSNVVLPVPFPPTLISLQTFFCKFFYKSMLKRFHLQKKLHITYRPLYLIVWMHKMKNHEYNESLCQAFPHSSAATYPLIWCIGSLWVGCSCRQLEPEWLVWPHLFFTHHWTLRNQACTHNQYPPALQWQHINSIN